MKKKSTISSSELSLQLKEFTIPFSGLKLGEHKYEYNIKDNFFSHFEFAEIDKANIKIHVILQKYNDMLMLNFATKGTVDLMCDTCAEDLHLPIQGDNQLIVKFGESHFQETDDIIIIPETSYELNVAHYIYEFIHLLLPLKRIHPQGKCNEEVVKKLKELSNNKNTVDSRWGVLEGLKYN